ncbi:unnamed protein product [Zymoseptoria tritici ST99CH_3D7]|uniref:Uncharacterized protein n=2 Tax=Zymoseptoria tritici TaxID=1047171 RepID=A0A1X7RIT2_ZYMT9|nr:unnamed protein product [Zymoseptoria tritici ST99CH_3D7]
MKITFFSTLAMLSAAVLAAPVQQRDKVTSKDDYEGCDKRYHGNGAIWCPPTPQPPTTQIRSEEPKVPNAPNTVNAPRDILDDHNGNPCVRHAGDPTSGACTSHPPAMIQVRSEE